MQCRLGGPQPQDVQVRGHRLGSPGIKQNYYILFYTYTSTPVECKDIICNCSPAGGGGGTTPGMGTWLYNHAYTISQPSHNGRLRGDAGHGDITPPALDEGASKPPSAASEAAAAVSAPAAPGWAGRWRWWRRRGRKRWPGRRWAWWLGGRRGWWACTKVPVNNVVQGGSTVHGNAT